MHVHKNWSTPGFTAPPIAERVGPFSSASFLEVWSEHFAAPGTTRIAESETGLIVLHQEPGRLAFAGHGSVTDYHTPRGTGIEELLGAYLANLDPTTLVTFDSLPDNTAAVMVSALARVGINAKPLQHEVSQILELPPTFNDYLAGLDKKQRHEMRRKRRRFEAELGPARLERLEDSDAVITFINMHRKTAGEKSAFMDTTMASFFSALWHRVGAVVDILISGDDRPHAMSFGFEDDDTYYLYNSAYDPSDYAYSPGIVLLEMLIRTTISAGRTRLDLLKGDERYKHRLGSVTRPLYLVTGVTGDSA